jgi:hypothetical protein
MVFDVPVFVLSELRTRAALIHEDVHLLGRAYHWSEASILAMPRTRRERYADMVRADRGVN